MSEPLGLFGGTFDPVHFGHLRLAEESIAHLGLGGVRWIPAGQPPHRGTPQVTPQQRLEMVRLAMASNGRFSLDPSEVEAAAPSYTVHTLERLRRELGAQQPLVLLVGADAFAGLATWHRWRDIFALAHVAVSHRPGFPVEISSLPHELATEFNDRRLADVDGLKASPAGGIVTFAMTQLAISATQIRKLLANDLSARYLLPDSVLDYIQTHSLYRNS
ncbi:nicotinate-nucleotide adenylyltransferase [Ferribacterium limneticum]|uniref:nicotinate-nucleotide adenylyltransferase n=1 Tax=Ferribacterium limneticum TaxID=76259 RepID=UPI001CFA1E5D|nr:nicotinate-nucleotide adenylyltransferase [Ferribacterium limneticum]UCV28705.1 nicotinate-nucleotide adenylyltransferase [Ferribacterium limneticum]UCV32622.1 nicotinate-nucleotide adenylyltransferase [Ferribacterium limneticum]